MSVRMTVRLQAKGLSRQESRRTYRQASRVAFRQASRDIRTGKQEALTDRQT